MVTRIVAVDTLSQIETQSGDAETWPLEVCASISCPTMALMGANSPQPARRIAGLLAETIPNSRLHVVPGAGHMLPLSDPHVVDPLIAGHIRAAEIAEANWGLAAGRLKAA